MKRHSGFPIVDPSVLKQFLHTGSELDREIESIPVADRATRLTLQSLSDELLYVEGLLGVDEYDAEDSDDELFFFIDQRRAIGDDRRFQRINRKNSGRGGLIAGLIDRDDIHVIIAWLQGISAVITLGHILDRNPGLGAAYV